MFRGYNEFEWLRCLLKTKVFIPNKPKQVPVIYCHKKAFKIRAGNVNIRRNKNYVKSTKKDVGTTSYY